MCMGMLAKQAAIQLQQGVVPGEVRVQTRMAVLKPLVATWVQKALQRVVQIEAVQHG